MEQPIVQGFHSKDQSTVHVNLLKYPIRYLQIYLGEILIGTFHPVTDFHIHNEERAPITVVCVFTNGYKHKVTFPYNKRHDQTRDFKPGDILVACDNFGDFLPPGYMGHAAMVIDEGQIIEAVTSEPQVRISPIEEFLTIHPIHMQLRSKDEKIAKKAANYAKGYLKIYTNNLNQGKPVPPFSFSPFIPLEDPWDGIYCSKLIWLSYYYGANMMFENDHFLFAPEDLATSLEHDDRFEVIYKHQDFEFKIDL